MTCKNCERLREELRAAENECQYLLGKIDIYEAQLGYRRKKQSIQPQDPCKTCGGDTRKRLGYDPDGGMRYDSPGTCPSCHKQDKEES